MPDPNAQSPTVVIVLPDPVRLIVSLLVTNSVDVPSASKLPPTEIVDVPVLNRVWVCRKSPFTVSDELLALNVPVLTVKLPLTAIVEVLALNTPRPVSEKAPRTVILEVLE